MDTWLQTKSHFKHTKSSKMLSRSIKLFWLAFVGFIRLYICLAQ